MADLTPYNSYITKIAPGVPQYNVLTTEMEGRRIKRRLVSTSPTRTWTLVCDGLSQTQRDNLLAHYAGQSGPLTAFNWTVPSWFYYDGNSPSTYTVFYDPVDGMVEEVIMRNVFKITIKLREEL